MKTKLLNRTILTVFAFIYPVIAVIAQDVKTLNLESAVSLALQNNHLLNVKRLQVEEKQQKVNEDRVKYLPVVAVGGSYQYNTNLPSITIEEGKFGHLPIGSLLIPLPAIDEVIEVGKHNIYNAGVTVYQPITQLGRINASVRVSKAELEIARTEQDKAAFQLKQGIEKLYFGLLIVEKQVREAEIKESLAKARLNNVENAIAAGKTTESNRYGLAAAVADEEQNLLKLKIQYDDYADDLKQLTGIDPSETLKLESVDVENFIQELEAIDTSLSEGGVKNNDMRIAALYSSKAGYAIRASKFSYLPDLGLLGGYAYQEGTDIYPRNNAFIGASLKWNLQDMVSNRTIQQQRFYLKQQAEENLANTREQVRKDIAKAYRKARQSQELIKVTMKVVDYRREDLKIQEDKRRSGLNLETDLLNAQAAMAKAESDLFAAGLNYRIALSELLILTGAY